MASEKLYRNTLTKQEVTSQLPLTVCKKIFLTRFNEYYLASKQQRALCNQSSVTSKLRDSARTATKWYDHNLLAGNLKKYQTTNIGYSQDNSAAHAMYVNNEEIKTVENLNLLGVTIDFKLNFTNHMTSICKKASQRIGVTMTLRNLIPTKAKLVLFKSAVLPYLTYRHLVWHFCRPSDA